MRLQETPTNRYFTRGLRASFMEIHGETPDDKENCEKYCGYFFQPRSTFILGIPKRLNVEQHGAFTLPLLVSYLKELETTNLGEQYLLQ